MRKRICNSRKGKVSRFVCVVAVVLAFVVSSAMAVVNNLESYHLRHDFSTGARVALLGPQCTADFIDNPQGTAVEGPNGPGSALHPSAASWGAVKIKGTAVANTYLATHDWTVALCLHPGKTEKGVLFAVGRQNTTNGRSAISLCSSSDPTKLYLYDTRKNEGAAVVTGYETITGLGNMTNGFHTVVMSYACASSNVTVYVDGVKKVTRKVGGGNKSYYIGEGLEYCQTPSWVPSGLSNTHGSGDPDVSFYDVRFYLGAFNDSDATAYAALYPVDRMGSPFRPSAYVESGATNATANATVGNYIDTGYLAKGATTRFAADYQFLDTRGQQRIFGARGTFTQGLYIRGSEATGNLAWNFMGTAKWVDTGKDAGRLRRIAMFDRVGKTIAVTNYADHTQYYYNNNQSDFLKATSDADNTTYLFAENNSGAKNFGKARIYSFEADEDGAPVLFLVPDMENGEAGFRDIITGAFHGDGNKDNSPERPLRFYNGVGCASDYKYEDSTLYAKLYASSDENGTVTIAEGTAAASAEGWVPRGGTLALSATPPADMEFNEWTGDTLAIADGFSKTDASIEVSTPYAVQLRATFKPAVNALLTIAADGADAVNWSAADWRSAEDASVSISAPADKVVTVVAHKSVTLTLDASVSLSKFIVQADTNCVVTFASGVGGSFYASEVVVSNGVLRQGSAAAFGVTPKVTVEDGGTFDVNGLAPDRSTAFVIAGAGAGDWPWALTSSVNVSSDYNSIDIVDLADDATIGGDVQICIGVRGGATFNATTETLPLTLNGHTLTKTGTGTLWFRRLYSANEGTIDVQAGTLKFSDWSNADVAYGESCISNIALVVREGTTVVNGMQYGKSRYTLYFKTLEIEGATMTSSYGAFSAWEGLSGHGSIAKLEIVDGVTAELDGDLAVPGALTAARDLSLTRAAGVETNVTVSATGTLTATNAITVGTGVIFNIGVNRPTGTFTVADDATLALRLTANDESPVLKVSANPANIVVYKPDGVTDITSGCTVEYDADAGTVTIKPSVPVWTNADSTGSFENAANWDTGEVPVDGSSICVSNVTDVTIMVPYTHAYDYVSVKGGGSLSFSGNGSLTANAMAFFDGTELKTGGVVVPAAFNGTGDLVLETGNGAEFVVNGASTLTGKLTIRATASFTNKLNAAVNVTNMTVDAGVNVVVTMVKGSGGSFQANEVVVAGGVLQQGSASVLGTTPKLTVLDGGTFDINKLKIESTTKPYIAGAGAGDWPWAICSSSGAMVDGNYLADITLLDDATIGGPGQLKIGAVENAANKILLNNHKLTFAGNVATLRNLNTDAGTMELAPGYIVTLNKWNNLNSDKNHYSGTTLIIRDGARVANQTDRDIYATTVQLDGGNIWAAGDAKKGFGPLSTLAGHGMIHKLVMPSDAVFKPDGTDYLNVTTSLSGKLKVDISDPALAGKVKIPLLKVPTALKDTADGAFDLTALSPDWQLQSKESEGNVEYWIKSSGFSIFIR